VRVLCVILEDCWQSLEPPWHQAQPYACTTAQQTSGKEQTEFCTAYFSRVLHWPYLVYKRSV
jgi:hypothetical protein